MKRSWSWLLLAVLLWCTPGGAAAQGASDLLEQGKTAFREGRYADAASAFERAAKADPQNAEAFFLLARVYAETPLADRKKANDALDEALELEPDNLSFLTARLQQLRAETSNFIAERLREARRAELAARILKLDSTNAFAHEELGRNYIHDFWRYRNAIMLPTLRFNNRNLAARTDDMDLRNMDAEGGLGPPLDPTDDALDPNATAGLTPGANDYFDATAVFQADRFDLDELKKQGVPIQDLSARAQRAYDRAIGHLRAALRSDPRRRSVYDDMMEIFALKGEFEEAQTMLQEMYAFFPEDAETWLYLGMTQYRLGDLEAAHRSFETASSFMTDDEKKAFSSLDYLLPKEEEDRYQQDPVAYASRFWTSKDPRYLTPYNERKLEHFARLVYADLLYGADDLKLRGWDTQRGHILVRYGIPNVDVVLVPSNTSMSARDVLGRAAENAPNNPNVNANDPGGNSRRILAQRGSGFDMAAEANTFNIWDYGEFRFVFEDPFRNGEYRLYSPSASEIADGVHPWLNDYAIRAEETFRKVPDRYEYEAPGRQIEMPYLVTAFKGDGAKTDLYVHYGIPITEKPKPGQEMINLTANVGAFLIGNGRDILVEERHTVYGLRTSKILPFKETNLWVDTERMSAPPGEQEVSMEFETASGSTVAVQRRKVDVPDFTTSRLALSDLMLAYHVEESPEGKPATDADVVRRGLSITPAPWSVFSVAQPIYLYFEAYNLERDAQGRTDYRVDALLVPKDRSRGVAAVFKNLFGGDKGVSVSLPASGTTPDDGTYLIMDATDQKPGLYTLILRVHDNVSGKTVEKDQDLFLE